MIAGFALGLQFQPHIADIKAAYAEPVYDDDTVMLAGGEPPADIRGTSRIVRDGKTLWQKPFLTGEANMSHSLANLEHHHFKYAAFRRPGDIHVHFFGTATLSCADGVQTQDGDVFEIHAAPFTLPLRNALATAPADTVTVKPL